MLRQTTYIRFAANYASARKIKFLHQTFIVNFLKIRVESEIRLKELTEGKGKKLA
jgi:hypothetical protein